jgi:hypothetical protein
MPSFFYRNYFKIDVVLSTAQTQKHPENIRAQMYRLCRARWWAEPGVMLRLLERRFGDRSEFQLKRRIEAEERSKTHIYVLADDDCLLDGMNPIVLKACEIMDRHPQFAILSLWPVNSKLNNWRPSITELENNCVDGSVYEDEEVLEHVSVGGIRFMRKGAMKEWPPMKPGVPYYDSIQCQYLRNNGFRSGYFRDIRMNHLGRNYSSIDPQYPGGEK